MATIIDIAQKADVSVATVSRVLHDSNRVSEEKRQRVLEAINELKYEINPKTSKNLKKKAILVLCGNVIDELLDGVKEAANELGYEVFIGYTMGQKVIFSKFIKGLIKNRLIDGIITIGISDDSNEDLVKIDQQLPIVQCCDEIDLPSACVVSTDDVTASYEAVNHLIKLGKKRIGFFGLDRMQHPFKYSHNREIGYRKALEEADIPIDNELIIHGDYTPESNIKVSREFLKLEKWPDAVFCVRDTLANFLMNTLHQAGVRVPEDIAVVGFGGIESSTICWPSLTTVVQSYYEIGTEAISLLNARINGKVKMGRKTFVHHKLIVRGSTVKQAEEAWDYLP